MDNELEVLETNRLSELDESYSSVTEKEYEHKCYRHLIEYNKKQQQKNKQKMTAYNKQHKTKWKIMPKPPPKPPPPPKVIQWHCDTWKPLNNLRIWNHFPRSCGIENCGEGQNNINDWWQHIKNAHKDYDCCIFDSLS